MVGGNIDFTVVDVDITTGTIYRYTGTATISGNTLTVLTSLPITPISYPGVPTAITTLTDFHPLEVGGNAYIAVTGTRRCVESRRGDMDGPDHIGDYGDSPESDGPSDNGGYYQRR